MLKPRDSRLLGKWRTTLDDTDGAGEHGNVTMTFTQDGFLVYTIHTGEVAREMLLRYRTEDGVLIVDRPSAPKEETASYEITPDNRLRLRYVSSTSTYIRAE
jgi:hypothetical protein